MRLHMPVIQVMRGVKHVIWWVVSATLQDISLTRGDHSRAQTHHAKRIFSELDRQPSVTATKRKSKCFSSPTKSFVNHFSQISRGRFANVKKHGQELGTGNRKDDVLEYFHQ